MASAVEKVAIYAVDPGTVSGVARGIFPLESNSVWKGLRAGKWESWEVDGDLDKQPWEIMDEFAEWSGAPTYRRFKRKGIRKRVFVIEDFVIRLGPGASSKRELLDPVRVANGCATLALNRDGLRWVMITYQQPSEKNFATNARLRESGLWVKGSEHRKDAVRHMAVAYAKVLKNG